MYLHPFQLLDRFHQNLCLACRDPQSRLRSLHLAVLGEMPETPGDVFSVAAEHVLNLDRLLRRIEHDLAPMSHGILEPMVTGVLADEALSPRADFELDAQSRPRRIGHPGYGRSDAFYWATGKFHALKTCNSWASDRMRVAGVKASIWPPFVQGFVWRYRKVSAD